MIPSPRLIELLSDMRANCANLLVTANELYKSKNPKERALAYEININVQKMMAEQERILAELQTMRVNKENEEEVCPENGYGALVD